MKHLLALWLLLGLTAVTAAVAVLRVQDVQHHQNDALHSIMCRAEHVIRRTSPSRSFTVKQKAHALRFYRSALSNAHLPPCG